jgi:hypothetical protein
MHDWQLLTRFRKFECRSQTLDVQSTTELLPTSARERGAAMRPVTYVGGDSSIN